MRTNGFAYSLSGKVTPGEPFFNEPGKSTYVKLVGSGTAGEVTYINKLGQISTTYLEPGQFDPLGTSKIVSVDTEGDIYWYV